MESGSKRRRRSIRNLRRSSSNFVVPNRTVLDLEAEENLDEGCKGNEESALAGYGSAWVDDEPVIDTINNQRLGPDTDSQNNVKDYCPSNVHDLENISLVPEGTEGERELGELEREYFSQLSIEKPREGDSFEALSVALSSTENSVNSPLDFSAASNSDLDAHVSSLDIAGFLYSPDTIANEISESYNGQPGLNKGYSSCHDVTTETVIPSPVHAILPSCSEPDKAQTPAVIPSSPKGVTSLCPNTFKSYENSIATSISATDVSKKTFYDVSVNKDAQSTINSHTISNPASNPTTPSLKVTFKRVSKFPTNAAPSNPLLPTIKEKKQKPSAQKLSQKEKTVKSSTTVSHNSSTSKQRPRSWNPDPISSSNLRSHPKFTASKSEKQKYRYPAKQKPVGAKSKTETDMMVKKPLASIPDDDEPLSPVDQLEIAPSNYSEATPEVSSVLGTNMAFIIQQLSSKLQSLQTGLGISSPRSLGQRQLESGSDKSVKLKSGTLSEENEAKDNEKFDLAENAKNTEGAKKEDEISDDYMFETSEPMFSCDLKEKCTDPPKLTLSVDNSEISLDSRKILDDRASVLNNTPEDVKTKVSKQQKSKKKTRLSLDKTSREKSGENLKTLEQDVEETSITPNIEGKVQEKYIEMQASTELHSQEMSTESLQSVSEIGKDKNEEGKSLATESHAVEMDTLSEDLLSVTQNKMGKDKNEEGGSLATGKDADPQLANQKEPEINFQNAESDVPPKDHHINTGMSQQFNLADVESPGINTKLMMDIEGGHKKKERKSKTKSARRSSRLFVPEEINLESPPADLQEKENFGLPTMMSEENGRAFVKNSVNRENTEIGNSSHKEMLGDLVQSLNKDSDLREYASVLLEEYNSPLKDRSKLEEIVDFVSLCVEEGAGQEKNNSKVKRKDKEKRRSSIYKVGGDYDGEETGEANEFSKNVAGTIQFQELEEYNPPEKDRSKLEEVIEDFVSLCVEENAGQEKNNLLSKASQKVKKKQRRRSSIYEASGDHDHQEIDKEKDLSTNVTETIPLQEVSALEVSSGMREDILSKPYFHSTQSCLGTVAVGVNISSCNFHDEKLDGHIDNSSSLSETPDEIPLNQIAPTESSEHLDSLLPLVPAVRRSGRTSRSRKSWDFSHTSVKDSSNKPFKRHTKQGNGDTQLTSHHLNTVEVSETADIRSGATDSCDEDENKISQEVKDYYCNKNYVPPKPRSWETIKESPTNALSVFTKTRMKRILLFEHGVTTAKLQRRRRKCIDLQKGGCGFLTPISDEEFAKKITDVHLLLDSP